jgi:hypothetical protein
MERANTADTKTQYTGLEQANKVHLVVLRALHNNPSAAGRSCEALANAHTTAHDSHTQTASQLAANAYILHQGICFTACKAACCCLHSITV